MSERAPADLSVAELVGALSGSEPGGGSEFAEEIIRRFQPALRHAWRRGGFQTDYRDFVQEVFTELFGRLSTLRHAAAFPGYLRQVALSVAARSARDERRHPSAGEIPEASRIHNFGEEIFFRAALHFAIEQLPPREQEVVRALFLEERSTEEVANRLQIEQGAVRTTKARALKRLRTIFQTEALEIESKGSPRP